MLPVLLASAPGPTGSGDPLKPAFEFHGPWPMAFSTETSREKEPCREPRADVRDSETTCCSGELPSPAECDCGDLESAAAGAGIGLAPLPVGGARHGSDGAPKRTDVLFHVVAVAGGDPLISAFVARCAAGRTGGGNTGTSWFMGESSGDSLAVRCGAEARMAGKSPPEGCWVSVNDAGVHGAAKAESGRPEGIIVVDVRRR